MSLSVYIAFLLATLVVVVVPGPTNTLIMANSVRHGRRGDHAAKPAGVALFISALAPQVPYRRRVAAD